MPESYCNYPKFWASYNPIPAELAQRQILKSMVTTEYEPREWKADIFPRVKDT